MLTNFDEIAAEIREANHLVLDRANLGVALYYRFHPEQGWQYWQPCSGVYDYYWKRSSQPRGAIPDTTRHVILFWADTWAEPEYEYTP